MSDTRPTDLISQREAAALIGRGIDTVRRWRREHGLRVFRGDSHNSPAMVSRAELLALAGRFSGGSSKGASVSGDSHQPTGALPSDAVLAMRSNLDDLRAQVADLKQQRAELASYVDLLRDHLAKTQNELVEKTRRLDAIEREISNPVRGLLTVGRRVIFGRQ